VSLEIFPWACRAHDQNWFGQYILIPTLSSTACMVLRETLTTEEMAGCVKILQRVYDRSATDIPAVGILTGANVSLVTIAPERLLTRQLVNVMQESVSLGLLTNNASIVTDALSRAYAGWVVRFPLQSSDRCGC
jgi:hypothetical protein